MKYYPNPATTAISFEFVRGYDKSFTLQLYNFMGKKVMDVNTLSQLTNLSLNGFYRGVYIFRLSDKNGNVIDSGKFQVVR
ncbi:MAG: T9SS type A sorting domain-containing protein [Ferruginibacter sp.]